MSSSLHRKMWNYVNLKRIFFFFFHLHVVVLLSLSLFLPALPLTTVKIEAGVWDEMKEK